uniref:Integrin alpha-2 domain-containing protein n=1 Tax=Electrophorus electricus TaxID=8005 RepID=A0A4W4E347_ELEEL
MLACEIRAFVRELSCIFSILCGVAAFNLDLEKPAVYTGPVGSYFGYSVDFYHPSQDRNAVSVLVGAPRANTSQPGIVEGGAVYYCPWPASEPDSCRQIPFDKANNRMIKVNRTREPLEFKSHQWFGATVRTHRGKVVACAPLYHWRTVKVDSEMDPVGTCYVAVQNFSAYAEYSPCRTNNPDPEGQGFCQAGFSVDFTKEGTLVVGGPGSFYWQGQVITAGVAEILNGYSLKAILRKVQGEKQTSAVSDTYDDSYLELVAGVPRGAQNFGYVAVINSEDLTFIQNFTGEQMASYFGYTVAVTDLNGDGLDDVLVGAPLYMDRELESMPREVGRVYLYLQGGVRLFNSPISLTGTHLFGRYGSAIAPLGDINQDGYLDVAIGAPFGGEDRGGRVFIYNGQQDGLILEASQVLAGAWASPGIPAGFGFTLRGDSDLDNNQYPDLIVGAFGAGKVVVYRARPVVTVDAQLILTPRILNPEDRSCRLPDSDAMVTCMRVDVCAKVSGIGIPDSVALRMELRLDRLKQRGAVKRLLFLDLHQHQRTLLLPLGQQDRQRCLNHTVYLRDEEEFRDKLSPISVALNYSLDQTATLPGLQLRPTLDHYTKTFHHEQANILLDCGDDNMCVPDLRLSAKLDQSELAIGDDNPLVLMITAANQGEGAYEAELRVRLPPEADYNGIERRREDLQIMNCEHRTENETQLVVCDLGNPMAAGVNVSLGLRFSVRRLDEADSHVGFELQILSSNTDNAKSNPVNLTVNVVARAQMEIRGVSLPAQVVLPFPRWEPKDKPVREDDIGPQVQHIYELHNKGPSSVSGAVLEVGWPSLHREEHLLYAMQVITDGDIRCSANSTLNPLELEPSTLQDTPELLGFLRNTSGSTRRRRSVTTTQTYSSKTLNCSNIHCLMLACIVGRLDRGQSAVVKVRSRLWAHTFLQRRNDHYLLNSTVSFRVTGMPYRIRPHTLPQQSTSIGTFVVWAIPDVSFAIPLWVIILAILLGLLVLAILTLAMWKCGFFDRARPPKDDDVSDREQLTAEKSTEA